MYATSFRVLQAHAFRKRIHSNSLLHRIDNRKPPGTISDRMTCVREDTDTHKRGTSTCNFGLEDRAKTDTACRKDTSCSAVKFLLQSNNCEASRVG